MAISRSQSSEQEKRLKILRSQLYGKESVPDFLNKSQDNKTQDYSSYRFKGPHGVQDAHTKYYSDSTSLKHDLLKIAFLGGLAIVSVYLVYLFMQSQFQDLFSFASTVKWK